MRILGFSETWPKLAGSQFTTFRFERKDRDWEAGEKVQVVLFPRTKHLRHLGVAEIMAKEPRRMFGSRLDYQCVSDEEAVVDGFQDYYGMWEFMVKHHGIRRLVEPINKFTLRWVSRIGSSK